MAPVVINVPAQVVYWIYIMCILLIVQMILNGITIFLKMRLLKAQRELDAKIAGVQAGQEQNSRILQVLEDFQQSLK